MRSIYVAASFPRLEEAEQLASWLRTAGFTVTSRWHGLARKDGKGYGGSNDQEFTANGNMDREDIDAADFVVQLTDGEKQLTRGGRHWEAGYARGLGKWTIYVGPKEQIFHWQEQFTHVVGNIPELLAWLVAQSWERFGQIAPRNTPTRRVDPSIMEQIARGSGLD